MTNKLWDAYRDWAAAHSVAPMTKEQFVDELLRLYPEVRLFPPHSWPVSADPRNLVP